MPTTDPLRRDLESLAHASDGVHRADPAFIRERGEARRNRRRAITGASIAAVFIAGAAVGSFFLPTSQTPLPAATPSTAVSATPAPSAPSVTPSEDASPSQSASALPSDATTRTGTSPQLTDDNLATEAQLLNSDLPLTLVGREDSWPLRRTVSHCLLDPSALKPLEARAVHYQYPAPKGAIGSSLAMRFASVEDATAARTTIARFYTTCDADAGHDRVTMVPLADVGGRAAEGFYGSTGWPDPDEQDFGYFEDGGVVQVGDRVSWTTLAFSGQDNNCQALAGDPDLVQCHIAAHLQGIAERLAR